MHGRGEWANCMKYALSFSGGKDSMLALDRAVRDGLDVARLFTIYEGSSDRVRFHGVAPSLVQAQARALNIPLLLDHTHPDTYEAALTRVLDRLRAEGIGGIVFGNIHLADIRAWYEERVRAAGFEHVEPLWHVPGTAILQEVIDRGWRARIISIDLKSTPRAWLGRVIDGRLVGELLARAELDPCGERGEFHSFVEDGPLFRRPVVPQVAGELEMEGHLLQDLDTQITWNEDSPPSVRRFPSR